MLNGSAETSRPSELRCDCEFTHTRSLFRLSRWRSSCWWRGGRRGRRRRSRPLHWYGAPKSHWAVSRGHLLISLRLRLKVTKSAASLGVDPAYHESIRRNAYPKDWPRVRRTTLGVLPLAWASRSWMRLAAGSPRGGLASAAVGISIAAKPPLRHQTALLDCRGSARRRRCAPPSATLEWGIETAASPC